MGRVVTDSLLEAGNRSIWSTWMSLWSVFRAPLYSRDMDGLLLCKRSCTGALHLNVSKIRLGAYMTSSRAVYRCQLYLSSRYGVDLKPKLFVSFLCVSIIARHLCLWVFSQRSATVEQQLWLQPAQVTDPHHVALLRSVHSTVCRTGSAGPTLTHSTRAEHSRAMCNSILWI